MTTRMLRGDVLARLANMPDAAVHCCVTSPPYYGLRDYQVAGQIGLEASAESYVASMVDVFREVRRVLRPDGTLWLNLGDSYASNTKGSGGTNPQVGGGKRTILQGQNFGARRVGTGGYKSKDLMMMPARVALALQADGWYLRSEIVWAKPNPMPESVRDRPTSAHEKIFMLSPSATYFYDAEAIKESAALGPHERQRTRIGGKASKTGNHASGSPVINFDGTRNRRNVWTVASKPFSAAKLGLKIDHFATFPPALIEPCIRAGTSAHGVCSACGAPWARVVERKHTMPGVTGGATPYDSRRPDGMTMRAGGFGDGSSTTIVWQPPCACAAAILPATVLDPFAGAGTVGLVADRLGRHAVLIEINSDYASMAGRRIQDDAGLFAEVTCS